MSLEKKNYLLKYTAYAANGLAIKSGEIRARNKYNEFDAKAGSGQYLERNIPGCTKVIFHTCIEDVFDTISQALKGTSLSSILFGKK